MDKIILIFRKIVYINSVKKASTLLYLPGEIG